MTENGRTCSNMFPMIFLRFSYRLLQSHINRSLVLEHPTGPRFGPITPVSPRRWLTVLLTFGSLQSVQRFRMVSLFLFEPLFWQLMVLPFAFDCLFWDVQMNQGNKMHILKKLNDQSIYELNAQWNINFINLMNWWFFELMDRSITNKTN